MADLSELEKAVEESEKIKKLVLTLLYWSGVMAFDASKSTLDTEVEATIKGEG